MAKGQDYVLLQDTYIPCWEKEFCYKIGSFEWERFLEAKRNVQHYSNIMEWNDSAGKQAFRIAKRRFYAQSTGKTKCSLLDLDLVNCYYKLSRKLAWPKALVSAGKKAKRIFLLTLLWLLAD